MPKMDQKTIDELSELSRIACTQEEKARFQKDLEAIFVYFEQLSEVNTDGIAPLDHVLSLTNVFREDIVGETLSRDAFMENVPKKTGGFVQVPNVIKGAS